MSTDPVGTTREVYNFLDMELSDSLERFLEKSTKTQDVEKNHGAGYEFMQVYSTSRNAQQSMNAWRQKIDQELLTKIQTDCGEMMKVYGYKQFDSLEEVQDTKNTYFLKEY